MSKSLTRFAAAAVIYIGFTVYLYQPHIKDFSTSQYLFLFNAPLACLGCFVLSRRWVASFWGSLFAGAIYGFGPFVFGLAKFHPTAVMAERGITNTNLVGFYHVPIAALIIGSSMLLAAKRFGIAVIFIIGAALACCHSFLNVGPIIWLSVPVLCCSVLIGAGMQGLTSAGSADRKWVLAAAIIMAALSIVTLLLAAKYFHIILGFGKEYAELFTSAAYMYILGTIALAIIFFMARARLRLHRLRLAILCSAMAVDIFFGARHIVDSIL
ncbi:MAG: hypothetical protein ACYS83_10645 [Planctomycetota bacterium]|jgi:hypothetical protein